MTRFDEQAEEIVNWMVGEGHECQFSRQVLERAVRAARGIWKSHLVKDFILTMEARDWIRLVAMGTYTYGKRAKPVLDYHHELDKKAEEGG